MYWNLFMELIKSNQEPLWWPARPHSKKELSTGNHYHHHHHRQFMHGRRPFANNRPPTHQQPLKVHIYQQWDDVRFGAVPLCKLTDLLPRPIFSAFIYFGEGAGSSSLVCTAAPPTDTSGRWISSRYDNIWGRERAFREVLSLSLFTFCR